MRQFHTDDQTSQDSFKCFCGESFASNAELQLHARIHTRETPHKCTVCGRHCTSLRYYRRHMKTCGEVLVTRIKKEVVEVEDEQLQQH